MPSIIEKDVNPMKKQLRLKQWGWFFALWGLGLGSGLLLSLMIKLLLRWV